MAKSNNPFIWIGMVCCLLLAIPLSAGGGWPQPKGKGYFKLSAWYLKADQHYTDAGQIDPNVTIGVFNTNLYGEYGFTDRLTGILYFPFVSRNYINNVVSATTGEVLSKGESLTSIGDTDISLKYGLSSPGSGIALAATITFGLPLGKSSGGTLNNLQTGDGEFNQLIQLDAGTGFQLGGVNFYSNIYVGYNNRTNDFSDEIRYGAELGTLLFDQRLILTGRLNVVESRKNGLPSAFSNFTSVFSNNTEFSSIGGDIAYKFSENMGVSIAAAGAFRGEIILARPSYSLGIFMTL
jgi:hypothetical protein